MHLNAYQYTANSNHFDYEFESIGPKGTIKKVVRLSPIESQVYNLGFGDLNELTGEIDDFSVSDNADTNQILGTVAQIVYDFTILYPDAIVFVQGTTSARTRLYQMRISQHWDTISVLFTVHGYVSDGWSPFEKKKNYEAFIAKRNITKEPNL